MRQGEECHLEVSKESFQVESKKAWENEQKSHNELDNKKYNLYHVNGAPTWVTEKYRIYVWIGSQRKWKLCLKHIRTLSVSCMGSNVSLCSNCLCLVVTCANTAAEPRLWTPSGTGGLRAGKSPQSVGLTHTKGLCCQDILSSSCYPQPFLPFQTVRLLPLPLFRWNEVLVHSSSRWNPKTLSKLIPRTGK